MPGYEKIESFKNGGSWGKFWWKTCGFERVNLKKLRRVVIITDGLCTGLIMMKTSVNEFTVCVDSVCELICFVDSRSLRVR